MKTITIKNVIFTHCNQWNIDLKQGDIITPVWKYRKCIMLLITMRKTGKAVYVDCNSKKLFIDINTIVICLPQGVTYHINEDAHLSVLSTMIGFYKANK